MAENFQDNVSYGGSTLAVSGDAVVVGSTNAGAKSIIFNNTGNQGHLAWQPTANRTISLPDSGGVIQMTGQAPGAIYDGANSISTGTIIFTNANGVSFSINGQTISGSVAAQTNQTAGLYALGNTTQNSSTTLDARSLSFNGLGNITVGYSNGSIQISGAGGGGVNVNVSAGTTSNNLTNFVFSNSNGVSFGLNGSTITASAAGGGGIANAAGTQTATSGTVVFSNSNGVTFGMSNSSVITASFNGTLGSVVFSNSNNITFGSAGNTTITASYLGVNYSAGTTSNNLGSIVFSNSNGISFGLNGSTVTASGGGGGVALSAGTNSTSTGTVVFSNSNGISFGMNTNGVVTGSVPAVAGSDIVFSNSNNIVFGKNVSTVTASAVMPALSKSYNFAPGAVTSSTMANGTVSFRYMFVDDYITLTRLDIPVAISLGSTTTSNTVAMAITSGCVIYTLNGSTLSPIIGQTGSTTYSWASSTSNYGSISGLRPISFGLATLLTPGDYWIGFQLSTNTSSVGAATTSLGNTITPLLGSLVTASTYADFGATNSSFGLIRLQGLCATTISNTTMTFNESQISVAGSFGFRANFNVILRNY